MTVKQLIIVIFFILLGYMFCKFSDQKEFKPPKVQENNQKTHSTLLKTPDELWEEQQKQHVPLRPKQSESLLPQYLLEKEAKAKEQAEWGEQFVDEIPLANPEYPEQEAFEPVLEAIEPDLDVLPPELINLEKNSSRQIVTQELIIPMPDSPENMLINPQPPIPAETEVIPEELKQLENDYTL